LGQVPPFQSLLITSEKISRKDIENREQLYVLYLLLAALLIPHLTFSSTGLT